MRWSDVEYWGYLFLKNVGDSKYAKTKFCKNRCFQEAKHLYRDRPVSVICKAMTLSHHNMILFSTRPTKERLKQIETGC